MNVKQEDYADVVDYWFDMISDEFPSVGGKQQLYDMYSSGLLKFFCIDLTGIFAYIVADLNGKKGLHEIVFYIMPKFRGSLKLVNKYIKRAEKIAKENSCSQILIGGNIGYKDVTFLSLLKRWGYVDHTVVKEIL